MSSASNAIPTTTIEREGERLNVNTSDLAEWREKGWALPGEEPAAQAQPPVASESQAPPTKEVPVEIGGNEDTGEQSPWNQYSAQQVRAVAADMGITGASRMNKAAVVKLLDDAGVVPDTGDEQEGDSE